MATDGTDFTEGGKGLGIQHGLKSGFWPGGRDAAGYGRPEARRYSFAPTDGRLRGVKRKLAPTSEVMGRGGGGGLEKSE